jgi:transposase
MSRRKTDPLRPLSDAERQSLTQLSRSQSAPAVQVARATILLAVAAGDDYQTAARLVGRRSGDAVSHLVARFNAEGLAATSPRHGGGHPLVYGPAARQRILAAIGRSPTPEADGTATWSLGTLREALHSAPGGLPAVSTSTLWQVLHDAGYSYQHARTWCATGTARRRRKAGAVVVIDPDAGSKKLIEDAYRLGEAMGLSVWCTDQAGPFQTVPYPGQAWCLEGEPTRQPHESLRNGTAKTLTLFHPADGHVRIEGATACPNTVLHPWLKQELAAILTTMPGPPTTVAAESGETRPEWERWQEGRSVKPTLLAELPPLRMLLVLDNLAGHKTPEFVCWLFAH